MPQGAALEIFCQMIDKDVLFHIREKKSGVRGGLKPMGYIYVGWYTGNKGEISIFVISGALEPFWGQTDSIFEFLGQNLVRSPSFIQFEWNSKNLNFLIFGFSASRIWPWADLIGTCIYQIVIKFCEGTFLTTLYMMVTLKNVFERFPKIGSFAAHP